MISALAAVRLQVLGDRASTHRRRAVDVGGRRARARARLPSSAASASANAAIRPLGSAQAMVGGDAGDRERALDHVEAVHRVAGDRARRPAGEGARVTDRLGIVEQEVGVEREDHARLVEVDRPARAAGPRRGARPGGAFSSPSGVIARRRAPAGSAAGAASRRRASVGDANGSASSASPRRRRRRAPRRAPSRRRRSPSRSSRSPPCSTTARAVGIVEVEDRGLRPGARRAGRRRVQLVALDLRRPALVALDQQAERARRRTASSSRSGAGCPGSISSGASTYGTMFSTGRRQPARPASDERRAHQLRASSRRRDRRPAPRTRPRGTRARGTPRDSGVPSSSPRLRQYVAAHRWHPEQSVGGLMWRSRDRAGARLGCRGRRRRPAHVRHLDRAVADAGPGCGGSRGTSPC